MSARVVSVSALLSRLKNLIAQNVILDGIWIEGEISNLTKHRSGHYYFSIKDARSEMSCVMFASYVSRLRFDVQEGMKVLISASVNIYEQRGSLQLYVRSMRPAGIGELYLEFEQRRKLLEEQGYFDDSRKKAQPAWIGNIGIITAREGAALQDVLITLQQRWPMMKVTLYPSLVQGQNAPASLIRALKQADAKGHDALLLVRGGGSFEDLFCFNDVGLVKTIASLKTFIVAGIGHEVDTTLAELAADVRVATPTYAAQYVSRDQYEVRQRIAGMQALMTDTMQAMLRQDQRLLATYKNNPYLRDPLTWIIEKQLRLDQLDAQMQHAMARTMNEAKTREQALKNELYSHSPAHTLEKHRLALHGMQERLRQSVRVYTDSKKEQLRRQAALLNAFSPLQILSRGYSIVLHDDHIVSSVEMAEVDEKVTIRMQDGLLQATITQKEKSNG